MSNIAVIKQPLNVLALYDNKPTNIVTIQRKVNLEVAMLSNNQLSKYNDTPEEAVTIQFIKDLIINVSDMLILNNKMTEMQAFESATLIFEKHNKTLNVEELALIFKKAKMGDFGKVFHSINVTTIFDWIDTYIESEERASFWEHYNRKKKDVKEQITTQDIFNAIPDEVLKEIKETLDEGKKEHKKVGAFSGKTSFGIKGLGMKSIINENKEKLKR